MALALFALLAAVCGAGWLLWTLARGDDARRGRHTTVLKAVVWFGLVAALAFAKLIPLALMVLAAAGAVMAIELWRDRAIRADQAADEIVKRPSALMDATEAAQILGVGPDASSDEIRSAHRKLIAQIHPDKGGTDYLAAKINEARDCLLTRLGES